MAASLESRLARALDADIASHVAAYMANIPDRSDALEYLADFVDPANSRHAALLAELRAEWLPTQQRPQQPPQAQGEGGGGGTKEEVAYMKSRDADSHLDHRARQQQQQQQIRLTPQLMQATGAEKPQQQQQQQHQHQAKHGGRRSDDQFVPLFSELGDQIAVAMLPGRHRCDCVATKHKLVNNCLGCGRIVCEQEGSGPCLFCGELVATKAETEILARGSKKSEQLRRQLMSTGGPGMEEALATKQKLLEYDRNSARRTKVIDDQMDYFETDNAVWLSDAERAKLRRREDELRQRRHKSHRERRLVYDFAGRQLVEDADPDALGHVEPEQDDVLREIAESRARAGRPSADDAESSSGGAAPSWSAADFPLVNPAVSAPPEFVAAAAAPDARNRQAVQQSKAEASSSSAGDARRAALRLQDGELRELRDDGHCLSLHQPWASLLVRGIKRHEGRTWYSAHRGRLWIAATARRPAAEEVAAIEAEHREYLRRRRAGKGGEEKGKEKEEDEAVDFPTAYPTGCLLGCVTVDEVLTQDDYKERYPDGGESQSPFVFVCTNPQELLLKLPMRGEHKIYRLDKQLHKAAVAGLRRRGAQAGAA